ncbi:hypothetical protein H4R99_000267 [Coemansia sp. RSA 1722]|nr:hypothetical protein LPJ57_005807 [Coemansia sp. RSA 486]KAJ2238345.1 hypothetical protein IWW45_000175 [Coemansia sp. RSA 485]KAJ2606633.1 hypothetical protein H4R99_000267 [Coemansia sp. RSA 1722]
MVKISLLFQAELNNVTDLRPADEDHSWNFKIECTSCREIDPNVITVTAGEENKISGSRGDANLVMKCKNCKREGSVTIVGKPEPYTADDSGQMKSILTVECRGLEPVGFEPRDGWEAKGVDSPTLFQIDLSEGEWYDYDENAAIDVSVNELKFEFVRSK